MKTKILLLAMIIAIAATSACKKDTQDSTSSSLSLKMEALNKNVSLPVQASGLKSASATATVVWDTAYMLVSKVKFDAEMESITGHDSLEIEYSWRGPVTINLFDLSATIGSIALPAGTYEKISLKVNSDKEDANGQPLFYLSGVYTNEAGTAMPLVVSVTDPVSFKTQQKNDTMVAGGSADFTSTIQLYLDQLLLQVDPSALDNAELTNGTIVISATSNKHLYDIILQNLRKDHKCNHEHHHKG
jgi:uncharacterized lipoprotein YajG